MTSIAPVSPGEMLQEEFLKPLGLTPYRLAKDIDVPATRVYDIVSGKLAITAETDLRLCRYFGLSDGWWLAVQAITTPKKLAANWAHVWRRSPDARCWIRLQRTDQPAIRCQGSSTSGKALSFAPNRARELGVKPNSAASMVMSLR